MLSEAARSASQASWWPTIGRVIVPNICVRDLRRPQSSPIAVVLGEYTIALRLSGLDDAAGPDRRDRARSTARAPVAASLATLLLGSRCC